MEIQITWCTEDVLDTAKQMEVKLTEEEANDVLFTIEANHDANFGITWDNIEWAIQDLVSQKENEKNEDIQN
jgi:hypothetical protein